jgi:hypothetical protein
MRPLLAFILLLLATASAVAQSDTAVHLGVATCAGSNCHGALQRPANSAVPGNEYLIWSKRDKHREAYNVLLQERSKRIARTYGLPDPEHPEKATLCLNCHADNVPEDRRGPQFQLSDGVGCEACHGGAQNWLGVHISHATHQQNVASGLYPTEQPVARANKCLGCHFGDATRFVDHRLYGAGHPRLPFELDTFTAIEPAHFIVDVSYIQRKGRITDLQVWAAGQAAALARRMDVVLDPKHAPHGLWPEFSLFDCQACHHRSGAFAGLIGGLAPGALRFNDAGALMVKAAAQRAAPGAAGTIDAQNQALLKATNDDWGAVEREAKMLRATAQGLFGTFAQHDFSGSDMRALADTLIALGIGNADPQFSQDEQITMALSAVVTGLKSAGEISGGHVNSIDNAMKTVYAAFSDETVNHDSFVKALKVLQQAMRR